MKKNFRSIIFLTFLLFPLLTFGNSPRTTSTEVDYSPVVEQLKAYVTREMDKAHVKGLSLALVDGNQVVWAGGFGYADSTQNVPAEADTLYQVGGLSRVFTALEILKLSEQGKLGLDDSLRHSLRGFSIKSRFKSGKDVTLRSLLAQHSGLPCFFSQGMWEDDHQTLRQLVRDLHEDYLTAPPQTLYRYSYLDYDLLGRVIELKTGQPFAQAMRKNLLEPLGMETSTFQMNPFLRSWMAKGYRNGKEIPFIHSRDVPMVGMISNAEDIGLFLTVLLGDGMTSEGKAFLSPQTLEGLFEPQYPDLPLDFGLKVGLGWMLNGQDIEGAQTTVWQDGSYPPYVSRMVVLPQERLGVVLLSNSEEAVKLAHDATTRALKLMLQAKTGQKLTLEEPKAETPKPFQVPTETLDSYTGLYSAFGQATRISRNGDHLTGKFFDYQFDLIPIGEKLLMPRFTFLFLFPIDFPQFPLELTEVKGQTIAVLRGLPFPIPLQKIAPPEIPEAWKARLGSYSLDNPDQQILLSNISLEIRDGLLTAVSKLEIKPFDFKMEHLASGLLPVSKDDAIIAGLFYGDGGTLHAVDEDGQTHIFYSGYGFTKIQAASAQPSPVERPIP